MHPLVMVHPETGRRGLYLGRRRNAYVDGMPLEESDALLDELWRYATADALTWYNQVGGWRSGRLGQPVHDASTQPLRPGLAAHHAPDADQERRHGRPAALGADAFRTSMVELGVYIERIRIHAASTTGREASYVGHGFSRASFERRGISVERYRDFPTARGTWGLGTGR
jgi:hypothetical protein